MRVDLSAYRSPADFEDLLDGLSPRERTRLQETLTSIPQGVGRALEIGFNDFRMTRALSRISDVTSIDLPTGSPVPHSEFKLVFSNIRALPFANNAFDLIVCAEVLEHLDQPTLRAGLDELRRVASKYILVTVPFEQPVQHELFRCKHCGHEENCMGHLRRIGEKDLEAWFPDWKLLDSRPIGEVSGYAPGWVYAVSRRIGNVWFDYWMERCPKCGATAARRQDNVAGFVLRRILWRLQRKAKARPAWTLALFQRN
jgi:Methyltransferase domain